MGTVRVTYYVQLIPPQTLCFILCGLEFGCSLNKGVWLSVSHDTGLRMLTGTVSSEGLAGAGGPISKMAPSCSCWQKASFPCHEHLSIDSLNVLNMEVSLSRTKRKGVGVKDQCLAPSPLGKDSPEEYLIPPPRGPARLSPSRLQSDLLVNIPCVSPQPYLLSFPHMLWEHPRVTPK